MGPTIISLVPMRAPSRDLSIRCFKGSEQDLGQSEYWRELPLGQTLKRGADC